MHTHTRAHLRTHGKSASSSLERQSQEADEINLLFCARFYCPGSVCKLQKCTIFSRHHLRPSIYGFKATASGANKQTKPKSKEIKLELVLLDQRLNASLCPIRKWITHTQTHEYIAYWIDIKQNGGQANSIKELTIMKIVFDILLFQIGCTCPTHVVAMMQTLLCYVAVFVVVILSCYCLV